MKIIRNQLLKENDEYKETYKKILEKWKDKGYKLKLLSNDEAVVVEGDKSRIVKAS